MKFLKILQKKQLEQTSDLDAVDNKVASGKKKRRRKNKSPELSLIDDAVIGKPESGFSTNSSNFPAETVSDLEQPFIDESIEPAAVVTIDPARVNPRLVAITEPNSIYCEEYRSLRTHLLHKSQKQKLQSIVVASVGPSEGKSVTALNLAWLLAQTEGIKTLVIDSDLRRPSLAAYLGIETKLGLSDVLGGQVSYSETIIQIDPSGLYLLPGGDPRPDVTELLSGPTFSDMLADICQRYSYVLIDAPPLGIFTDAAVLINQADGAILIVQANQTPYKEVERILDMLPRDRMLGVVLNQSEEALLNESYYYYDYYNRNK